MNPQFNYTNGLIPQFPAPSVQLKPIEFIRFNLATGNFETQPLVDPTAAAGINPLADLEKKLTDNLPNYVVGAVGIFMLFAGITVLAAPVAKEVI